MELMILVVAAVLALIIYFWVSRPDPRLPPSPRRPLPIVGHLFYMADNTRPQFKEWRERCGEIYSLVMGGTFVVVISGFDLIKEALVKKADVSSDRPPNFINEALGLKNHGIIEASGAVWKEHRSVGLNILRAFGMGKNILAQKIEDEVDAYLKYLASLNGKPTDIRVMTNVSTSNIICSILIGRRFEYDDKEFQDLLQKLISLVADANNVSLINYIDWLRYIPGDFFKAKKLMFDMKDVLDVLMKFVEQNKRPTDDPDDVCNLIEAYFVERNKKIQAGVSTTLDDQNLLKTMFDLFIAGTETTSTTITWCILYLLRHPDIQERVYQEINDNIGTDRAPTIQDKTQMTYLNAVIAETQRLASIVSLSLPHMCPEEMTIRGYTLPKGTIILPDLDSVLYDQATWGNDVMTFRPDRFIDASGKLVIPEQFIPFGIGRRVCLGESIARMELFLFLSSMLQKFKFLPATDDTLPGTDYVCGIVIAPKPYQVRVVERN